MDVPSSGHSNNEMARVHRDLNWAIVHRQDSVLIEGLKKESDRLQKQIEASVAMDRDYNQLLQREYIAHSITRDELRMERKFLVEATEANAKLNQAFEKEQERHRKTAAELERVRRSVVDIMQLEEHTQCELREVACWVTDVILRAKLELEERYREPMN
ncbi:hypothetical protein I7I51_01981 [Histoplasma capsulatum]|uniref:Uncharacterized protein n=1 Tax=Ajellomyces capsulatus TaxID=5037 RepID=A0A8A1MEH9_AJECA|nr:hypothetical protein I7I51_01981 [Histoplasma capsulatum]